VQCSSGIGVYEVTVIIKTLSEIAVKIGFYWILIEMCLMHYQRKND